MLDIFYSSIVYDGRAGRGGRDKIGVIFLYSNTVFDGRGGRGRGG